MGRPVGQRAAVCSQIRFHTFFFHLAVPLTRSVRSKPSAQSQNKTQANTDVQSVSSWTCRSFQYGASLNSHSLNCPGCSGMNTGTGLYIQGGNYTYTSTYISHFINNCRFQEHQLKPLLLGSVGALPSHFAGRHPKRSLSAERKLVWME